MAGASRLRPQPKEPLELNLDQLSKEEWLIIISRIKGLKLAEIAKKLGAATVWRREKTAIARMQSHERNSDVEVPSGTHRRLEIMGFPYDLNGRDVLCFLIEQGLAVLEKDRSGPSPGATPKAAA